MIIITGEMTGDQSIQSDLRSVTVYMHHPGDMKAVSKVSKDKVLTPFTSLRSPLTRESRKKLMLWSMLFNCTHTFTHTHTNPLTS